MQFVGQELKLYTRNLNSKSQQFRLLCESALVAKILVVGAIFFPKQHDQASHL